MESTARWASSALGPLRERFCCRRRDARPLVEPLVGPGGGARARSQSHVPAGDVTSPPQGEASDRSEEDVGDVVPDEDTYAHVGALLQNVVQDVLEQEQALQQAPARDDASSRSSEGEATPPDLGSMLRAAVDDALQLKDDQQATCVPAAVECLLSESEDRSGTVKMLKGAVDNARSQLPSSATTLLDRVSWELDAAGQPQDEVSAGPLENGAGGNMEAIAVPPTRQAGDGPAGEEGAGEEGTPFSIGPHRLPLDVMLKVANCLAPEDMTPAAGACNSLCISININLQYALLLVRLLRFIVLGHDLAWAIDGPVDSGSSAASGGSSAVSSDSDGDADGK